MNVDNLKRDPARVNALYTVQPDGSVVANRDFEIHLPKRFVENGMAEVGEVVTTAAVLGVVVPGEFYGLLSAMVDITLMPLSVNETVIKGVAYLVLEFSKGDTVIENLTVIQDSNKPYAYMLEFYYYAKIPWYMNKNDVTSLFDKARQQSGSDVGSSPQVIRVYTAMMFRDPDNLDKPYRYSKAMLEGREPVIVGLNNGPMLIEGTFAKASGGYLADNTLAAIINPDEKVTDLEKIIRGIPI
jgi:hypothetical protein